jgi:4-amino-4-deoxy-L-arabinose transferase-like glycosyltransferase
LPAPELLALLFWFCWLLNYALVYSYAGGIMHFYYLSTMTPAIAALAAIGIVDLWRAYRDDGVLAWLLPLALILCAGWELCVHLGALGLGLDALRDPEMAWASGLHAVLICGTLAVAVVLAAIHFLRSTAAQWQHGAALAMTAGIASLLTVPAAWMLSSVLLPGHGILPSADLFRLDPSVREAGERIRGRFGQTADVARLVALLRTNRAGERFLLTTSTTQLAAPIIITTGEAVLARGGYHGLDNALSVERLAQMVKRGEVRFALLGDVAQVSRRMGADAMGKPVADWIRANGKPVPPQLWRGSGMAAGVELFDILPERGLRPAEL